MTMTGAMATSGITCRITAKGEKAASAQRERVSRIPMPTPPASAVAKASAVIWSVTPSAGRRMPRSAMNAASTAEGAGSL